MKKTIAMLVLAFCAGTGVYAQSTADLVKQQKELNKVVNYTDKASKAVKKEAKKLEKEGWKAAAGMGSIADQLNNENMLRHTPMSDNGEAVSRYILQPGQNLAGTLNVGAMAARTQALTAIAGSIQQSVVELMDRAMALDAVTQTTVEEFHSKGKSIIDGCLTNTRTVRHLYRERPDGKYEVQVVVAYDRAELKKKLEAEMRDKLKLESDALYGELGSAIDNM